MTMKLYERYRPGRFEDVVAQDKAIARIRVVWQTEGLKGGGRVCQHPVQPHEKK